MRPHYRKNDKSRNHFSPHCNADMCVAWDYTPDGKQFRTAYSGPVGLLTGCPIKSLPRNLCNLSKFSSIHFQPLHLISGCILPMALTPHKIRDNRYHKTAETILQKGSAPSDTLWHSSFTRYESSPGSTLKRKAVCNTFYSTLYSQ